MKGNVLTTDNQMAFLVASRREVFWTSGQEHRTYPVISLKKTVTIGSHGLPHAIGYDVTFTIPKENTTTQFCTVRGGDGLYAPRIFKVLDIMTR